MTVFELLSEKFAEECESGLIITYSENGRTYRSDFRDDFAAETFGNRDIASYTYFCNGIEECDELVIELK